MLNGTAYDSGTNNSNLHMPAKQLEVISLPNNIALVTIAAHLVEMLN